MKRRQPESAVGLFRRVGEVLHEPFRREPEPHERRPRFPELVRRLSAPIILFWMAVTVAFLLVAPIPESVVKSESAPLLGSDTRTSAGLKEVVSTFGDGDSDNVLFLVLENLNGLNQADHDYYDRVVHQLRQDRQHVGSVQDFWSDPDTEEVVQSQDGKAAYAMVIAAGAQGSGEGLQSITAIREAVAKYPTRTGTAAYVAGPGAMTSDTLALADEDMIKLTLISSVLIFVVALVVYRSLFTVLVITTPVAISVGLTRAAIGYLGAHHYFEISVFSTLLPAAFVLGACTDYSIFFVGRYQEARRSGRGFVDAYHDMFRGVSHVVLASGLTIAGACICMSFTELSLFHSAGIPCAIGILISIAVSLTLTPALVEFYRLLGFLEPKEARQGQRWRKLGAVVVRWPGPVLAATVLLLAPFAAAATNMRIGYDEREQQPASLPSLVGYQAIERHFQKNRLNTEFVFIQADHDLRNPADMVILDQVAAKIAEMHDVEFIQSVTRPLGRKIEAGTLTYQAGYAGNQLGLQADLLDERTDDFDTLLRVLESVSATTSQLQHAFDAASGGLSNLDASSAQLQEAATALQELTGTVSEKLRPIQDLIAANPSCNDQELCHFASTALDSLNKVGNLGDSMKSLRSGINSLHGALPITGGTIPTLRSSVTQIHTITARLSSLIRNSLPQLRESARLAQELGNSYGDSEAGGFFLPADAFTNKQFKKSMDRLVSHDGRSTRMIVYSTVNSFTLPAIDGVYDMKHKVEEALWGTKLQGSRVIITGVRTFTADVHESLRRDTGILAVTAFALVFAIVLLLLRSVVAALVVVLTSAFSFLAAAGITWLIWWQATGIPIHWGIPQVAFAVLVAIGADYNLLLTSRMKEESRAGLRIGMIRSFASTGTVVTTAGIVFGLTMFALLSASGGNTQASGLFIGIGLLLDTFIVRTFLLPSVAALLGRWFWWPLRPSVKPVETASAG
jgi:RND superfamily putative drug exporter